jgi:hypothetical protein
MTVNGITDTTILIHLFRGNKDAMTWVATQSNVCPTAGSCIRQLAVRLFQHYCQENTGALAT